MDGWGSPQRRVVVREILSPAGECVARAMLNAFRPDSLADFLSNENEKGNGNEN